MENIGKVIGTYRKSLKMTQAHLAEGICSIKYLYCIENGLRNPSATLLIQFSKKMGVDLFSFEPFLDCTNPIEMFNAMRRMSFMRRRFLFDQLVRMRSEFEFLEDFRRLPWSLELDLNHHLNQALLGMDLQGAINQLQERLDSLPEIILTDEILMKIHAVMAFCQVQAGDDEAGIASIQNAKRYGSHFLDSMQGREYQDYLGNLEAVVMCLQGRYSEVISLSEEIEKMETEWNQRDLEFIWMFCKAYAYLAMDCRQLSLSVWERAMFSSLSFGKEREIRLLEPLLHIRELLEYHGIDATVANVFAERNQMPTTDQQ